MRFDFDPTDFWKQDYFFWPNIYYQSFMWNQEGKTELQKKVHRRICQREITFLIHALIFCCSLCLPPTQVTHLLNSPDKDI